MIVLFTGFVPEPENQIKGGWLFVSIFFMQIIWNMFFAFSDMARVAMLSILKVYKIVKFKVAVESHPLELVVTKVYTPDVL